ncbi:hypothetical protein ABW20_dc0106874 [Dactylellina cionopaga]|nr:hypothetical protein ABW20_dc0106874 [Dactylellina cionopaga]
MDNCDTPDEMYTTAENLLAHMLKNHSIIRWTCDYCVCGTNEEGSTDENSRQFDTAQEWESHIASKHEDMIPVSQRTIFAELNKQPMIGPLSCPLCQFTTPSMDTKIDDHILQHMHEFALRALPEGAEGRVDQESDTSRVYGLLSHTRLDSADVAIARDYSIIAIHEVLDAIVSVWHLLPESETKSFLPKINPPSTLNMAAFELWHTKSRQLKEILDAFRFTSQDIMAWGDLNIRHEVMEVVKEINFVAETNIELPLFSQSKISSRLRVI